MNEYTSISAYIAEKRIENLKKRLEESKKEVEEYHAKLLQAYQDLHQLQEKYDNLFTHYQTNAK